MPHLESGLLALRTKDPAVLDRAINFFRQFEEDLDVELIRVDGGKSVVLAFGATVKPGTSSDNVDVSAFKKPKVLGELAKLLRMPLWAGHMYGGYTESQQAMAISAAGRLLWTSKFDYGVPVKFRTKYFDPFSTDEERAELARKIRASAGYGRIGVLFGCDFHNIISNDHGDALFTEIKAHVPKGGSAADHAKFLRGKFVAPEGTNDEDGSDESSEDGLTERYFRVLPDDAAASKLEKRLAGVLGGLLKHRKLPAGSLALSTAVDGRATICRLKGQSVPKISGVMNNSEFAGFMQGHVAGRQGSTIGIGRRTTQENFRSMFKVDEMNFKAVPLMATAADMKAVKRGIDRAIREAQE